MLFAAFFQLLSKWLPPCSAVPFGRLLLALLLLLLSVRSSRQQLLCVQHSRAVGSQLAPLPARVIISVL